MGKVIRIAERTRSRDSISALEILLADARRGELLGVAYVAIYRGRVYIVDVAGSAKKDPTFTRGAIAVLDDEVGKIIRR